jgi:DNA-binding FadR family transcriptional regulator
VVEPMISRLAAVRMTDDELGELRTTVDEMRDALDDQVSFVDANKRFHDVVAWSSGNALFGYVIESRDPDAAEARMRAHIQADEHYAEQTVPDLLDESIPWDQRHFA